MPFLYSKHRKVFFLLIFVLLSWLYAIVCAGDYAHLFGSAWGSKDFSSLAIVAGLYEGQAGIFFLFAFLMLIPFITNYQNFKEAVSGAVNNSVVRIGWKRYFVNCLIQSVEDIWYFPIVINLCLAVFVHLVIGPAFGEGVQINTFQYFAKNAILGTIIMTVFQIIGWAMLNCWCFLFSQIIKNRFLYPFMLVLICLVPVLIVVFVSNLLVPKWNGNAFWNMLFSFQLLAPGTIHLIHIPLSKSWIVVSSTYAIQLVFLAVFTRFVYRKKVKNG